MAPYGTQWFKLAFTRGSPVIPILNQISPTSHIDTYFTVLAMWAIYTVLFTKVYVLPLRLKYVEIQRG